jgi:lipoprotein-anchoring transpeptidase ErfK/SrfK
MTCTPAAAQYGYAPQYWDPAPPGYAYAPRYVARRHSVRRDTAPRDKAADQASAARFGDIPKGPLQIYVSIDQQKLHLYSDGAHVADSSVATGVPGLPTPLGVFSIIQKQRYHESNIYSNAPMPFMERITWSGVALHEGENIGHRASHGCIRLPHDFAAELYGLTKLGVPVVVANPELKPVEFADPHLFVRKDKSPVVPTTAPAPDASAPATDGSKTGAVTAPGAGAGKTAATAPGTDASKTTAATAPGTDASKTTAATAPGTDASKTAAATAPGTDASKTTDATAPGTDGSKTADATDPGADTSKTADAAPGTDRSKAADGPDPGADASKIAATAPSTDGSKTIDATAPGADTGKTADAAPAGAAAPVPPDQLGLRVAVADPAAAAPALPAKPAADVPAKKSPIAIFISRKEKKIYVRQDFAPLFDAPITIEQPDQPLGTHVFTALEFMDDHATLRWNVVSLPVEPPPAKPSRANQSRAAMRAGVRAKDQGNDKSATLPPPQTPAQALARIDIPQSAIDFISALMVPGSSLIVSDQGLGDETGDGTGFVVVTQ